ncbi:MAG TPA: right-handed parallel beta-helix repeat-containing protein, partial [Chloroflexota bacterium]|nr:right-handed parallel beta-helix repeat-containing protein [Chloroflexota bacterium]
MAPASSGGSDSNDCSSPTVVSAGVGPCETLLHATQAATGYFWSSGHNQQVDVYMEDGTYDDAANSAQWNGSSFSTCDATVATCTAQEVIDAQGSAQFPIVIAPDPENGTGNVTIQRPANAGTTSQQTPLLDVFDSSNVEIDGITVEGVQTTGADGNAQGTGCLSTCVDPGSSQGEVNVTYDPANLPSPGTNSGIALDGVSVDDSNWTCLYLNNAEYVTVDGGDFTDCGSTTSEPAVYLGASNDTFENSTVGYGAGFGVFVKAS